MFSFFVLTAKTSLRKLFGRLVKSVLVLSTLPFLGKLVFWRFVSFWVFGCIFLPYAIKFQCGCQKIILSVCESFWKKKNFFEKFIVFFSFSHTDRFFLNNFVEKRRKSCENGTLPVQKINFPDKKLKYPQFIIILVLTAKNSYRKYFDRLMKSVLIFSTVTFWGKLSFWWVVFFSFWIIECKFYALWQKKLSENVKTSVTVFAGFFRIKCFFSHLKHFHSSCTLSRMFWAF